MGNANFGLFWLFFLQIYALFYKKRVNKYFQSMQFKICNTWPGLWKGISAPFCNWTEPFPPHPFPPWHLTGKWTNVIPVIAPLSDHHRPHHHPPPHPHHHHRHQHYVRHLTGKWTNVIEAIAPLSAIAPSAPPLSQEPLTPDEKPMPDISHFYARFS